MSNKYKQYANEVLSYMTVTGKERSKIRTDIIDMLAEKELDYGDVIPEEVMGPAIEMAKELSGNDKLVASKDYISSIRIFGLPLVHISKRRNGVAKGIIAMGSIAIGVISIGGISVGVFSLGGLSVGLLALGGGAIGYSAIGGVAIAYEIAIGGAAIANNLAIGGFALANEIAIGGSTVGKLMMYSNDFKPLSGLDEGQYQAFKSTYQADFYRAYQEMYPKFGVIKDLIMRFFK